MYKYSISTNQGCHLNIDDLHQGARSCWFQPHVVKGIVSLFCSIIVHRAIQRTVTAWRLHNFTNQDFSQNDQTANLTVMEMVEKGDQTGGQSSLLWCSQLHCWMLANLAKLLMNQTLAVLPLLQLHIMIEYWKNLFPWASVTSLLLCQLFHLKSSVEIHYFKFKICIITSDWKSPHS